MSTALTPSKRPLDENENDLSDEPIAKEAKMLKSDSAANDDDDDVASSSGNAAVFRLLFPKSKIGYVSDMVNVTVEDGVLGCDERVVVVGTSEKSRNEDDSVKKAVQVVFERMVEGEKETEDVGEEEDGDKSLSIVLRLLVMSNQIGCILGVGGSIIKQMAAESGAQIRILPSDKVPLCTPASCDLVQITGEVDAVRKALYSVTQKLLDNMVRAGVSSLHSATGMSAQPSPRPEIRPPSERSQGTPHSDQAADNVDVADPLIPKSHVSGVPGEMNSSHDVLSFRLLCQVDRVGGVIGKGGTIIRTLKQETGCGIKIMDAVPDSEERVVIVSGPVHPDDRISAVQDAVLRVHGRILRAKPTTKEQPVTARLLLSSNQIGYFLDKGGATIVEMRDTSGANIDILGKDQIPKCVSDEEEVIQIIGQLEAVNNALLQITSRLQHHFFQEAFPSLNHPPDPAFSNQPPLHSYLRRGFSPPRMLSDFSPSLHKYDTVGGLAPHGGFPRMHLSERRPWDSQGHLEGRGPIGLSDFAGAPQRRIPWFGGSQPAIITSTTIEAVIPSSLIPIIYGEDGECLRQIRQISDAKITITEPLPGAKETSVIISGTPEETHAAQSLIQAFVMSETDPS